MIILYQPDVRLSNVEVGTHNLKWQIKATHIKILLMQNNLFLMKNISIENNDFIQTNMSQQNSPFTVVV